MQSILTLKCPNCGANLDISPDMAQFACGYCGANQIVERRGGTVALKLISDAISRVQAGTDKTASELAIRRLTDELQLVNQQSEALRFQASSLREQANRQLVWIVIFAAFIGLVYGFGVSSCIRALIPFGIVVAIGGIKRYREAQMVDSDLATKLPPLQARAEDIQRKINKHKYLVDT